LFRIHESTPNSKSLVLTDHKNNVFIKIGGTKKIHGSNSRNTSRTQRPFTKFFFSKQEFIENLEFFGKPASYPFRKVSDNEIGQTLCRNFNHKIYNSKRFQNAILHQNLSTGTQDIFNCTSKNVWNWMKKLAM
jgi:hypothetical protein